MCGVYLCLCCVTVLVSTAVAGLKPASSFVCVCIPCIVCSTALRAMSAVLHCVHCVQYCIPALCAVLQDGQLHAAFAQEMPNCQQARCCHAVLWLGCVLKCVGIGCEDVGVRCLRSSSSSRLLMESVAMPGCKSCCWGRSSLQITAVQLGLSPLVSSVRHSTSMESGPRAVGNIFTHSLSRIVCCVMVVWGL